MKIAIAVDESKTNINPIGARAPYFLIFEGKKLVEEVKNPFLIGPGAGPKVASLLMNKGIQMFIAGRIGPNLKMALERYGIKTAEIQGNVHEVLEELSKLP